MMLTEKIFGKTKDGGVVTLLTMKNSKGMEVDVLDYGCTIQAIRMPDKDGNILDICLGYATIEEYENNPGYLGAVIGRHGNRIGAGRFVLQEKEYTLACNDSPNHLHGGDKGFDKWVWAYSETTTGIRFFRTSPHGEEGYPGNLDVTVFYDLSEDNALCFRYEAISDQDTVLNMTNHTYFNLGGEGNGSILEHILQLNATGFAENDAHCLPTGKTLSVEGTAFDFRQGKPIGQDIGADSVQLAFGKGYDHNFVLDRPDTTHTAVQAGVLFCPQSGIRMTITTTKPCIQLYTGNVLGPVQGKTRQYEKRAALCLETQFYPNSMACSIVPNAILKKNVRYTHETSYRFDQAASFGGAL